MSTAQWQWSLAGKITVGLASHALIMRHRLCGVFTYSLNSLRKEMSASHCSCVVWHPLTFTFNAHAHCLREGQIVTLIDAVFGHGTVVLSVCLSVCNVGVLWPNGWLDEVATW